MQASSERSPFEPVAFSIQGDPRERWIERAGETAQANAADALPHAAASPAPVRMCTGLGSLPPASHAEAHELHYHPPHGGSRGLHPRERHGP